MSEEKAVYNSAKLDDYPHHYWSGDVAGTNYELAVGGVYGFELSLAERVIPYVRMTQASKWSDRRAQDYLARQDAIRALVREIMHRHNIEKYLEDAELALGCTFYGKYRGDLSNMEKAVEDALQGVLYPNDRQIRMRLAGGFQDAETTGFEVQVVRL